MSITLSGTGDKITHIKSLIEQVARVNTNVLITGASGTGKEIAASMIHALSNRKDAPFVPVNCAAIPNDLLESELFGHEKGAFSGAYNTRVGRFEMVKEGTIFLDEIGDMPLPMQAKLLRVIQEKKFERIGSNKSISFNARIIAATHQNLEDLIAKNEFREDLFYRLNVFPIKMPSLSERDDLTEIINDIIMQHANNLNVKIELENSVLEQLQKHPWPGNIRELANLVERLMVLYPNQVICIENLPDKYRYFSQDTQSRIDCLSQTVITHAPNTQTEQVDLKEVVKQIEIKYIQDALDKNDWVVSHAAASLSLRRTTLIEKMKKYNLKQ